MFVEIADAYVTTVRKIRATLDDIEDMFHQSPEVPIRIYEAFEQHVIDINTIFVDRFIQAFSIYNYDEMRKINNDLVEAVIVESQKFLESKHVNNI